jgi:glyoxylase-like metal-dependent hydrolase (beta-lactamase superfamily II)
MQTKLPDVWRINGWGLTPSGGLFAAVSAEAFCIFTPEPVLIDCGSHLTYTEMRANLVELGVQPRDIKLVIGTHCHWDHIDSMHYLAKESGAEFAIHRDDADTAEQGFHDDLSPNVFGLPVRVDYRLEDGQELTAGSRTFRFLHVPGHSPGSACILTESRDGRKVAFVGDALHGIVAPLPGQDIHGLLQRWALALEALLQERIDVLFEGHTMPELPDITGLDASERTTFVEDLLARMERQRRGVEKPQRMISERHFLLAKGFLHFPDYYLTVACDRALDQGDR